MMRMKRFAWLAIALCLCCFVALAEDFVIVTVNGKPIWYSELAQKMTTASVFNRQTENGSPNDENIAREGMVRGEVLEALVEERVLLDEAKRRGFTADNLRDDIDERFRKMVGAVASYVLSSYPDLEGDALMEQVESLLSVTGASLDSYYETAAKASLLAALEAQLIAEAPVPDEADLQVMYDTLWQEQKVLFDKDENAFEAALLSGAPVVYRPCTVKQIQKAEFLFEEGSMALINQTEVYAPETAKTMREDQLARCLERAQAAWMALNRRDWTFSQLLDSLNASADVNYFGEGSTRFSKEYADRAIAFTDVGEYSSPYPMPNGYAILYYVGDLPACLHVPFLQVREVLLQKSLHASQQATLQEAKDALMKQAHIEWNEEQAE